MIVHLPKKTNTQTHNWIRPDMSTDETLVEQVKRLLIERSKKAMTLSKQAILEEQFKYEPLGEALRYFMSEIWYDASHPSMLSLACEAVGGDPDATTNIGAALVMLAGAADIHDDIIDQSFVKEGKQTIFGKFGMDIAIISGNVLWFKGMLMLNEACDAFPAEKKKAMLMLAKQSFFDIGSAEGKEASLRRNLDLQPEEYLEIIKMKISVAEAASKIGAIAGNGTAEQVECLGKYGKTLGTLMTIRDEFIDMFDVEELKNRFKNECLPLPILYAFKDSLLKKQILELLSKQEFGESELEKILELVSNASEVHSLGREMHLASKETSKSIAWTKNSRVLLQLLNSALEGLPCESSQKRRL